jgi:hypothetical protein
MIQRIMVAYYVDREFGGGKLARARSADLKEAADRKYKEAGQLRKEAQALLKPRRKLGSLTNRLTDWISWCYTIGIVNNKERRCNC